MEGMITSLELNYKFTILVVINKIEIICGWLIVWKKYQLY